MAEAKLVQRSGEDKKKEEDAKLAKEEKEEKLLVKAAIKRQKENELFEINQVFPLYFPFIDVQFELFCSICQYQSLAICFGDKVPKKRSEVKRLFPSLQVLTCSLFLLFAVISSGECNSITYMDATALHLCIFEITQTR